MRKYPNETAEPSSNPATPDPPSAPEETPPTNDPAEPGETNGNEAPGGTGNTTNLGDDLPEAPEPSCSCCGSTCHFNCECEYSTWDTQYTDLRILNLASCLEDIARDFINYMETTYGIQLRITDAYRNYTTQDELCMDGASTVCGGYSYHNYGLAFDVVEISGTQALYSKPNWELIGSTGESFGLEWGGRWTSFVDKPHFQLNTKPISELNNGAEPCS